MPGGLRNSRSVCLKWMSKGRKLEVVDITKHHLGYTPLPEPWTFAVSAARCHQGVLVIES